MFSYRNLEIEKIPFNAVLRVTLHNSKVFTGDYVDWTSAGDNEPDGESITVEMDGVQYELFLEEIEYIEQVGTY